MYLITYRLLVGSSKHYAPSAKGALSLINELRSSGGMPVEISRTRDGLRLRVEDLERLAAAEAPAGEPSRSRWPEKFLKR